MIYQTRNLQWNHSIKKQWPNVSVMSCLYTDTKAFFTVYTRSLTFSHVHLSPLTYNHLWYSTVENTACTMSRQADLTNGAQWPSTDNPSLLMTQTDMFTFNLIKLLFLIGSHMSALFLFQPRDACARLEAHFRCFIQPFKVNYSFSFW